MAQRKGGIGPLDPIFDVQFTTGFFAFNNTPGVTPLTVTINKAVGQDDPTDSTPILFTVVFSEPVTSFDGSMVTLTGTAGATTAVVSGAGPSYTVTVSGMVTSGGVTANILAGVTMAVSSGQPNSHSTSTDNTVAFSAPPPVSLALVGTPMSGLNIPYYGDYLSSLQYMIVADLGNQRSYICDVSTNSPSIVGSAFVSGQSLDACWVNATHALALWNSGGTSFDGVYPIDTTIPSAPVVGSRVGVNDPIYMRVHGSFLAVGGSAGTSILDISNPSAPILRGTLAGVSGRMIGDPNNADVLYVAAGANIIAVDISTPTIPVSIFTLPVAPATNALDVAAVDDLLYFMGNSYVGTVDITNPAGLVLLDTASDSSLGGASTGGITVEPNGLYGYACATNFPITGTVSAWDFSIPTNIQLITSVSDSNLNNPTDLQVVGDRILVISQQPKLSVLAITR